jgi:hypothetical protein
MALIFLDTLTATDTTGLYTLMGLVNGSWTDIMTIAGPSTGTVNINETSNTIPVDTDLLNVGQTYQFKWVDSADIESNIITVTVPINVTFTVQVAADTEVHILLDGSGTIHWADGSAPQYYYNNSPVEMSHFYQQAGTYAILVSNVTGLKNITFSGNASAFLTGIDQLPDTLIKGHLNGNKITNTTVPQGPDPVAIQVVDLSYNLLSSDLIDGLIMQFATNGPDVTLLELQGQTPPAPPTSASAAALAQLIARGVTVLHD